MKTILSLFIFLAIAHSFSAQTESEPVWGKPMKLDPFKTNYLPVGICNGRLIAVRSMLTGKDDIIEVLNPQTLTLEHSYKANSEYNGKKIRQEEYFIFSDHLMMLGTYRDNSSNSVVYTINEIDGEGQISRSIELASFKIPAIMLATQKNVDKAVETGYETFKFKLSENKKTIMVSHWTGEAGVDNTTYKFAVINESLEIKYATELVLPFHGFTMKDWTITENGEAKLTGFVVDPDQPERKQSEAYFIAFDPIDGKIIKTLEMDYGTEVRNMQLKSLEGNKTVLYGVFAKDANSVGDGIFFTAFDSDNTIVFSRSHNYAFNSSFSKEDGSLLLRNIVVTNNGSYLLSVEEYHTVFRGGSAQIPAYVQPEYGKVFIFDISRSGEINFNKEIIRDGSSYQSFFQLNSEDAIHLVYPGEVNRKEKTLAVQETTIYDTGNESTINLAQMKLDNVQFQRTLIEKSIPLSSTELILFCWNSQDSGYFVRMKLKE